jgi:hypothetical protein
VQAESISEGVLCRRGQLMPAKHSPEAAAGSIVNMRVRAPKTNAALSVDL